VEDVAETLQELWISYNLLQNVKGAEKLVCASKRERRTATAFDCRKKRHLSQLFLPGVDRLQNPLVYTACSSTAVNLCVPPHPLNIDNLVSLPSHPPSCAPQPKLRVLYLTQNLIAKVGELDTLKECKALEELTMIGNPVWNEHSLPGTSEDFREQIAGAFVFACGCIVVYARLRVLIVTGAWRNIKH
jgi:hypothetical protein